MLRRFVIYLRKKVLSRRISLPWRPRIQERMEQPSSPIFYIRDVEFPIHLLVLVIFAAVGRANYLVYNTIGVLYPMIYSLRFLEGGNGEMTRLHKYWVIYGIVTLLDTYFGIILSIIPGYNYFKIAYLYMLVRNDFKLAEWTFALFYAYYLKMTIMYPLVKTLLHQINGRLE